jgi:hypothetical protein
VSTESTRRPSRFAKKSGTKVRLRISAFRDSAAARALRAESSTADWDAPPAMAPIVAACTMRCSSEFFTNSLCALLLMQSSAEHCGIRLLRANPTSGKFRHPQCLLSFILMFARSI